MNCVRTRGEEPPRLYGVINGLLRMRNGLRRSQELDDLVDVLVFRQVGVSCLVMYFFRV